MLGGLRLEPRVGGGLREQADAGPRGKPAVAGPVKPGTPAAAAAASDEAADEAEADTGPDPAKLGCRVGDESPGLALLLLGLLGLRRRRD